VGIATQIDSIEEAEERGLRRFVPRVYDTAVDSLVRLFSGMGEEIKEIVGALGFENLQDLVGRSDLLEQVAGVGRIDLSDILRPAPIHFKLPEQNISTSDITGVINGTDGQLFFPSEESFSAPVSHTWDGILAEHRIVGTRYAAHRVRDRFNGSYDSLPSVSLKLAGGSVPGHGLGAFNSRGVDITVYGGGEDGVGKMAFGGNVSILKSLSKNGTFINGSVGKSFCYGAQKGTFLVQGNADSRACIRFSGADVVFGGELQGPLQDELGSIASRANLKGFAFEYMTNGRAVVMGDPGPWICAGMTGGMIYQRIQPELGLDIAALQRRIAIGAKVSFTKLGELGHADLNELLGNYRDALATSGQAEAAAKIDGLLADLDSHFIRIAPEHMQVDADVATE
jgi:glutamate synthase (NADPH/NADH) large chain